MTIHKLILLSVLLILLAACDGLGGVGLDPQILTFSASPDTLEAGESSTLAWNVVGGADDLAVTLNPGNIELDAAGEYDVTPSETTIYILSAMSGGKTATRELTLSVNSGGEPGEMPEDPGEEPEDPEETVLEGDITVASQADLDALAGVTQIEGSLFISSEAETLNFTPLGKLKTITVDLSISDNPDLTRIDGFSSLNEVGAEGDGFSTGFLSIQNNPKLVDLDGFTRLKSTQRLDISANDSLKTFSGFEMLEQASILIAGNPVLETLPDFSSLTEAGVEILNNPELLSLPGFDNLTNTYGLFIEDNDALASVSGFASLGTMTRGSQARDESAFVVSGNARLVEVTGFEAVSEVTLGQFAISDNPKLKQISGFSNLRKAEGLSFSPNPELEEVSGFEALEEILLGLQFTNLPSLKKIPEFGALKTLGVAGMLIDNTGLTSVEGFDAVTQINELRISANPALTDISGFAKIGVTTVDISSNPVLTRVGGFDALEDGSGSSISENALFDCSVEPQASLSFLPIETSVDNLADCPTN